MGWINDDIGSEHEGFAAARMVTDGKGFTIDPEGDWGVRLTIPGLRTSGGETNKYMFVDQGPDGRWYSGTHFQGMPDTDGWRGQCDGCGWWGEFHPNAGDPTDSWPSDELEDQIHAEWKAAHTHIAGTEAVKRAGDAAREADAVLSDAVVNARRLGASWPAIATATGLRADTAEQRWSPAIDHAQKHGE